MHGEHPDHRDHRQRDAVAMGQRGGDQNESGYRDAIADHVGHRGGVELHIGHCGERRRQRGCGGRSAGRTPPGASADQKLPGQQPRAEREEPDRRGQGTERVGGGRRGPGQLRQHGGQRVEGRRVIQCGLGLHVAQFAHMSGRGLAGVQDPPDGVGVPDGIPVARDRLPVRHPAPGGIADRGGSEKDPGAGGESGPIRAAGPVRRPGVALPFPHPAVDHQQRDRPRQGRQRGQRVPPDSGGAEPDDGQAHHPVGQRRADRQCQRPPQAAGPADDGTG